MFLPKQEPCIQVVLERLATCKLPSCCGFRFSLAGSLSRALKKGGKTKRGRQKGQEPGYRARAVRVISYLTYCVAEISLEGRKLHMRFKDPMSTLSRALGRDRICGKAGLFLLAASIGARSL